MTDLLPVLPSPDDPRDYIASMDGRVSAITLPPVVELDVWEIDDQAQHGSCLANAVTSAIEIYLKRKGQGQSLSRMYVYWWIRALSKMQGEDSGGYPRNMVKAIDKFGVCHESIYPYVADNLYRVPTEAAIIEAIPQGDWEYERIPLSYMKTDIEYFTALNTQIKTYLAQGIPVLLTLNLDNEFTPHCSGDWRTHDWRVKSRPASVTVVGGHEVLIVGYDDTKDVKRFKVLNSWGKQWGDQGYFGLMYRPDKGLMWQSTCVRELWVVKSK